MERYPRCAVVGLWLMLPQRPAARDGSNCIHFQAMWQKHMHAYVCVINSGPSSWPSNERGCLNVVGVPCLQVASGAEEVVQHIKVVEQLQDALADTVGMCVCKCHSPLYIHGGAAAAALLARSIRYAVMLF